MATDSQYYDTNPMIRQQLELSEDVHSVAKRLENLEAQVQVLVKGQEYIIRAVNKMAHTRKNNKTTAKHPIVRRKLQSVSKEPTPADVSKLLHLPQALQKNISKFTDQMLLKNTSIPDDLFETECLSENECEVILSKPSPKDQIRMLIRKIKGRGPHVITKFLEIVGKEYPTLPEEVNSTQERLVNEHKNKPMCIICVMKNTVDLKDIGDTLWEEEIISADMHGDIYDNESVHNTRQIHWDYIINAIHSYEDSTAAFNTLKSALEQKYKHIVEYLNQTPESPSLSCCCCKPRRVKRRNTSASDFGSQTEYSTTSSRLLSGPRLPTVLNDTDDAVSVASQISTNLPSETLSFGELGLYDTIDVHLLQDPHISSSSDQKSNKSRHSSGNFIPSSNYNEQHEERIPSVPLADNPMCLKPERSEIPSIERSVSHQSSTTVCAGQSTSSGDISPISPSKPSDNQLSSDLSPITPPEATNTTSLIPSVQQEEESAKETDEDQDSVRINTRTRVFHKRTKSGNLPTNAQTASESDLSPLRRDSRSPTPRRPFKLYLRTKPRPVLNCPASYVGVGRRRSKKSKKRALRRQQSQNANFDAAMSKECVRDTEYGLKKPFNPLWRKGDIYNKTLLQPPLVPSWDYYQARRHNRMAHLAAKSDRSRRDVENDSDFVTEDSETITLSNYTI